MSRYPKYDESEKALPPQLRIHCICRLGKLIYPLSCYQKIFDEVISLIKVGYMTRNPLLSHYKKGISQGTISDMERNNNIPYLLRCLSGLSGTGKSTVLTNILNLYPQLISHRYYHYDPFFFEQITWLKTDCSPDGNPFNTCFAAIHSIDRILKDKGYKRACPRFISNTQVFEHTARLFWMHGLGIWVIDEIQRMDKVSEPQQIKFLEFLSSLTENLGIPVLLLSTTKSNAKQFHNFVDKEFQILWERLDYSNEWNDFIRCIFNYQWTTKKSELTTRFSNTFYQESQGIVGLALKLYILAQIEAIILDLPQITSELIHQVAKKSFLLSQPLIKSFSRQNFPG